MTTTEIIESSLWKNGNYYIGLLAPNTLLDVEIPEGIDPNGWDKELVTAATETEEAVYRQKTFGESFLFRWECLDGEKVLAVLRAAQAPTMRATKQSVEELEMLIGALSVVGFTSDDLIVGYDAIVEAKAAYCTAVVGDPEDV